MSDITYIKGDVISAFLDKEIDVFAHGCNCQGVMGSGVARQVKDRIPSLYYVYRERFLKVGLTLGDYTYILFGNRFGFNLNTQDFYGTDKRHVDYLAVSRAARGLTNRVYRSLRYTPKFDSLDQIVIGIPKIGAGLGGGDWEQIIMILGSEWKEFKEIRVYEFDG